ncbi:hypothetical protein [Aestuariispira insulae]|uniref:Uncharacterized protein n=1 Tax=Aestuariispira insulae TaxID=1461337 RepID=A0A3D9HSZ4_9PROT|nr:hypothetical protein [Aestuariispira insulae]RED52471.1 hypothetical protein DFP90_102492 [Aestuariispira insulae]
MSQAELENRIKGMIEEIEQARVNLSQGKDFGLEAIGERVAAACAEVTALSDEDSVELRPILETLRTDLINFSEELGEISRRLKEIEDQEAEAAKEAQNEAQNGDEG